jgi:hypothetical protein
VALPDRNFAGSFDSASLWMTTNYLAPANALLSRALRRFAAFSWMIPRLAALSIAEISVRTCSGLGVCAERTVFCIVRKRVTTLRLCSDRFTVWRARLAADFVFAIVKKVLNLHARQRIAIVNPEGFSQSGFARRRASVQGLKRYNRLFSSSFAFCR